MINSLSRQSVREFIKAHVTDDPALLVLKHREIDGIDIKLIAEQIICRQKVVKKLPQWAENFELIFPGVIAVEQASSTITAKYKANLYKGDLAIDLTGGLGVDSLAFSENFEKVFYVEADRVKAKSAKHNFEILGKKNIEVFNSTAEDFLNANTLHASLIYIDPDRRPEEKRVFTLEKSQPDVISLKDQLLNQADRLLIKASPMLDIHLTRTLLPEINTIHVVSVNNDCKELLCNLEKDNKLFSLTAANYSSGVWKCFERFSITDKPSGIITSQPEKFIYEPNVAIMKAGLHDWLAEEFGLKKLHPNTHLYTSTLLVKDFPGRIFNLLDILPVNKKALRGLIPDSKANLAVKNFPTNVDTLKKQLKVKDGGAYYIFACMLNDRSNKLLITQKHNHE